MYIKTSKLDLVFVGILLGFSFYFIFWGIGLIGSGSVIVFLLSTLFGIFMAFNIGGNDVANSFGTSVGAGTLSITQALCVAAIFEASGAVIAGGEVTSTIRSGIIAFDGLDVNPNDFIFLMMSALFSAGLWLLFASKKGLPVSTTHAIVGGIVGGGLTLGFLMQNPDISPANLVKWENVGTIAISWVASPLIGGILSYSVYSLIKKYIINYNKIVQIKIERIKKEKKELRKKHKKIYETLNDIQKVAYANTLNHDINAMQDPNFNANKLDSDYYKKLNELDEKKEKLKSHKALELGIPMVAAGGAMVVSGVFIFKGLKNLNLGLNNFENYLIIGMITILVWFAMFVFAKTLRRSDLDKSTFLMFSWLQVFTASGFAFSHGSNDIANAVGPFVAILDTLATNSINPDTPTNPMIMLTFTAALVAGLWFMGREVIATVGGGLTQIHPASGFSAEISSSAVVMAASILGLPISSTHVLIGAILGIGLVNKSTNWGLMKPIGLAWIITLPASALMASFWFLVFRAIF